MAIGHHHDSNQVLVLEEEPSYSTNHSEKETLILHQGAQATALNGVDEEMAQNAATNRDNEQNMSIGVNADVERQPVYAVPITQFSTKDRLPQSSKDDDKKAKLWSISTYVVSLLGFISMVEYSLVMPSLEGYVVGKLGGTEMFYGGCMAAFSLGRLCFMPVLGLWGDRRRMLEPFLFSLLLSILGNLLYGCAEWAQSKWFVLFGRLLVGIGAANSGLCLSYFTRVTNCSNRTSALATLNGLNLIGIVLGPVFNSALGFTLSIPKIGLSFNRYTNPGFVMVVLFLIFLTLLVHSFVDPPPPTLQHNDEHTIQAAEEENDAGQPLLSSTGEVGFDTEQFCSPLRVIDQRKADKTFFQSCFRLVFQKSLWIHFVFSFVSNFIIAELEATFPKLTRVDFGWTVLQISGMYSVLGILTASTLFTAALLNGKVTDRAFMVSGILIYGIAMIFGHCFLIKNPNVYAFCAISIVFIIATPLLDSPNVSAFSKRLQNDTGAIPYLGLYLSLLQAGNSVARILASLYAGWALMTEKDHTRVYMAPTVIWGVTFVVLVFSFDRLKPLHQRVEHGESFVSTNVASIGHSPVVIR